MRWYFVFIVLFYLSNHDSMSHRVIGSVSWRHRHSNIEWNNDEATSQDDSSSSSSSSNKIASRKSNRTEAVESNENLFSTRHSTTQKLGMLSTAENAKPQQQDDSFTNLGQKYSLLYGSEHPVTLTTDPATATLTTPPTNDLNMGQNVQNCLSSCSVTAEYNPVCGTNFVTYNNPGNLYCAKMCGVDVNILMQRRCPSIDVLLASTPKLSSAQTTARVKEGTPLLPATITESPSTRTAGNINLEATPSIASHKKACISSCVPVDYNEKRPVCGTDNITYPNAEYLLCVQFCGIDVKLKHFSVCTDIASVVAVTTTSIVPTLTIDSNFYSCLNSCLILLESNPVCGTDNITYKNAGELQCFRSCGINVQIKQNSPCRNNELPVAEPPVTEMTSNRETTPLPTNVRLCINICPMTQEDKPVCGTDRVTYKNPSHLRCAQICGVSVQMQQESPCSSTTFAKPATGPVELDEEHCIQTCMSNKSSIYKPVCGSNKVTYKNIDHLLCALTCNVDVTLDTFSPCEESPPETLSTTDSIIKKSTNTASSDKPTSESKADEKLISTISPDIINCVFLNQTSTESEEFDIDPRFNSLCN